jgi:negative regulator of flagellin synthesis FlgM
VNLDAYIKNAHNGRALKPSTQQGKGEVPEESVKLSAKARELQKAREIVEATPEIREDQVGRFKREIEAGAYNVKGDKIAEKMLKESLIDAFV